MDKLLQNRRLDVDIDDDDDSEQKINALQLLVKNNIQESLQNQHKHLSGDLSPNHMAYVVPSAEHLNMYNSQVEILSTKGQYMYSPIVFPPSAIFPHLVLLPFISPATPNRFLRPLSLSSRDGCQ